MSTKGTAVAQPSSTSTEVVTVRRYGRARFVAHRDTETYTGVPRPVVEPRVLLDKSPAETVTVRLVDGDTVAVYSAELGGSVLSTLGVGGEYTITGRVWLESNGTSLVRIARTG